MNSVKTNARWRDMIGRSFEPRQWYEDDGWPDHPSDYLSAKEGKIMWVYRKVSTVTKGQWSVGFYSPDKEWHQDSAWDSQQEAAKRVHWLNGGDTERQEGIIP